MILPLFLGPAGSEPSPLVVIHCNKSALAGVCATASYLHICLQARSINGPDAIIQSKKKMYHLNDSLPVIIMYLNSFCQLRNIFSSQGIIFFLLGKQPALGLTFL